MCITEAVQIYPLFLKESCVTLKKIASIMSAKLWLMIVVFFGEQIIAHLTTSGNNIGRYPIYAESSVTGVGYGDFSVKEGNLILIPFPYDD